MSTNPFAHMTRRRLEHIRDNSTYRRNRQFAAAELERRGLLTLPAGVNPPPNPPPAAAPPPPAPKPSAPAGPLAEHFKAQFYGSPTCCGTSEWGNFVSNTYADWNRITDEQLAILTQRLRDSGKSQLYSFVVPELGYGQLMAEIVLPKLGFTKVNTFINTNGGNQIQTWLWTRPSQQA